MIRLIKFLLTLVTTSVRSRMSLQAENAALRNQLSLYRKSGQRPRIRPADRLLWCFIAKFWAGWRTALYFVQPRTVTTWQKKRFRDYWRALSQSAKPGRPRISRELRKLIERMWEANPTWGSPKIVAELAMLGIDVAKSTVEKYRPKRAGPPSPTWRTFLDQHVRDLVSIDFFIVPTATFRVLFVFIVLAHDRRRIVHFNVTEHPTAQWTAQQIVEAFPFDTAPSYLIRDGDGIYGERVTRRIESLGIDEVVTAPASPWQNALVERLIGSIWRDCLDRVIVLNERHLKRILARYFDYYYRWRTHLSLGMDSPESRLVQRPAFGKVVQFPEVGGLHHHYERLAA